MKTVIITGSTRGLGLSLAAAFLDRGCAVVVSGRSLCNVERAVQSLGEGRQDRVVGAACDVSDPAQVEALWHAGQGAFGRIDIWISNAGLGHATAPIWEVPDETARAVVSTNIVGVINCARVAVPRFLAQGSGQLYNMEGFGSDLSVRRALGIYAASKAAVRSLTLTLAKETAGQPVQIGALSPGMVVTDLLLDPVKDDPVREAQVKRITNILGERAETVAPWLADRVLANNRNGVRISWLSTPSIAWKFATAPFRHRDLFAEPAIH